ACTNPLAPDGTTCDDNNMCSTGDLCLSGICTSSGVATTSHCAGPACDQCSFDPDVGNCVPATDGCDMFLSPSDRGLCEDAYACFTSPANHCVVGGDLTACWC